MKPFAIYHRCKDAFSSFQQPLIDIIVKAAKPEMIFLLGGSLYRKRSESIFHQLSPTSRYISDYFLLVLIRDLSKKNLHEWQDKIESNCKFLIPVTIIVLQTVTFEEWLKTGHRFAWIVWQSAVVIYDSGSLSRIIPKDIPDTATGKEDERLYMEGVTKAKEFLAGSELFHLRKQHAMAAFMLHQSAEQALHTILKIGTGYHANTHSIERLLRYASLISYQLPDIFPQKTDQEKRLFNLLQRAYIDTRYKKEYKISNDDLACLTNKVRHIHDILSVVGKSIFNYA